MNQEQQKLYNQFIAEKSYEGEKEPEWTPARVINVVDLDLFIKELFSKQ